MDGKIGPASDEKTKESLFAEGRLRYAKKQPPGFEDLKTKKDAEPERLYGDFLVWKQCLEHFAKKKTGLIFITGEKKSDWVRKAGGRVLGPHPDLVSEYANAVGGERFHLYDLANFLTYASPYVNVPVEKDAILEAEKLAKNESSHSSVLIAPRQSFGEMMRNLVRANENGTVSESFWKGFAAGNNLTSVVKMSPPDVRDPTDVSVNKAEEPDTE